MTQGIGERRHHDKRESKDLESLRSLLTLVHRCKTDIRNPLRYLLICGKADIRNPLRYLLMNAVASLICVQNNIPLTCPQIRLRISA